VRLGRRPLFFLATALVCILMIPPTPNEFRWVNVSTAGLALFWAVLVGIEDVVSHRQRPDDVPPRRPPPPGIRPA
jgi:hypothetical protein